MKTYLFKVVLEKDKWSDEPEENAVWRAYLPALSAAHAWGDTAQEALENLRNAVDLILEDLLEQGEPIPEEPVVAVLVPQERVDQEDAWFWSEQWQEKEREADEALAKGQVIGPFENAQEALKALKQSGA